MQAKQEKIKISKFQESCYTLLKQVPKGKVTTYKDLAIAMGNRAYRAVGTAMNKNPYPIVVPCHRVVAANGTIGGFAYGLDQKRELLSEEGIEIDELGRIVDFEKKLHKFRENSKEK